METRKLIFISTLLATSVGIYAFAQDAGMPDFAEKEEPKQALADTEEEESDELPPFLAEADALAASVKNANSSAQKFVGEKGWRLGLNSEDGRYVAIGSAKIASAPNNAKHQLDRQIAFEQAMVDAKSKIARYYLQEVSTSLKKN